MSLNATQTKKMTEFQGFLESPIMGDLIAEGATMSKSALSNAFQLYLLSTKTKRSAKPRADGVVAKKAPSGPQCMACTYTKGGSITSKQCTKVGRNEVNGVYVCDQHAGPFAGLFKTGGKNAVDHPGFCCQCTKLAGRDIYHRDCNMVNMLGSVCGTIKPVCLAKAREHTEYTHTDPAEFFCQDIMVPDEGDHGVSTGIQRLTINTNLEELESPSSGSSGTIKAWEQITTDIGDGEQTYWMMGDCIYSNEDEIGDRVLLGEVDGEGVFQPEE